MSEPKDPLLWLGEAVYSAGRAFRDSLHGTIPPEPPQPDPEPEPDPQPDPPQPQPPVAGWSQRPVDGWRINIGDPIELFDFSSNPAILLARGGTWPGFTVPAGSTVGTWGDGPCPIITPGPTGDGVRLKAGAVAYDLDAQGQGSGTGFVLDGDNCRIEGCRSQRWNKGIECVGRQNVTVHRSRILDSTEVGGWILRTVNFTMSESLIDHTIERHGQYDLDNTGLQYERCVFSRNGLYDLKLRGPVRGALIVGNYSYQSSDPFQGGNEGSGSGSDAGDLHDITIADNIFDGYRQHFAIGLSDVHMLRVLNNTFIRSQTGPFHAAIDLLFSKSRQNDILIRDNRIHGHIGRGIRVTGADGVTIRGNLVQTAGDSAKRDCIIGSNVGGPIDVAHNALWATEPHHRDAEVNGIVVPGQTVLSGPVEYTGWLMDDAFIAAMRDRVYPQPWPMPWIGATP